MYWWAEAAYLHPAMSSLAQRRTGCRADASQLVQVLLVDVRDIPDNHEALEGCSMGKQVA
jgi:hypothetical protein